MLEYNESGASELLAPVEGRGIARGKSSALEQDNDIFAELRMPETARDANEEISIVTLPGALEVIHGLGEILSSVINRGKAALLKKSGVGFLAEGFDGLNIKELVEGVSTAIEICHAMGFDSSVPLKDRVAAITFAGALEDFQYCFMELEPESLGRSDARALLPAFEKFKQVCMQLELELLVGDVKPERN